MKTRFTTIDLCAVITELRESLLGMRVANVYDIDNKTYLIRLGKSDVKVMLLIESGNRLHTTEFEWPKNLMPSGFSMKCRKHIRSRRLVNISQLGIDRIVDLQFGSDEAAYHLIVELYDRGNIVLTDYEYTILSLLRTRTDTEDVRFAVREKYPVSSARQREPLMSLERLREILAESKEGMELRKVLNPHVVYGAAVLEHCLTEEGFLDNVKIGNGFNLEEDLPKVMEALKKADGLLNLTLTEKCKGVIVQKREQKPSSKTSDGKTQDELLTYQEFYPFLLNQHKKGPYLEFPSFDKAVDEFFSKIESQKIDMKALSQEKSALKKLDNIRKDHQKRIEHLQKSQDLDMLKAELVELNLPLVDKAILIVNSAIANQIDWSEINSIMKEAQSQGDQVACAIAELKLDTNHITMNLRNPYDFSDSDSESDEEEDDKKSKKKKKKKGSKFTKVDVNLALSAYANARSFYDKKKFSSKKEQKTIDASEMALKSAEKKTKETLKEVETTTRIKKARKTYWFEKFLWFISSENYLVIGGRDQQQNELVVKRHLEQGDLYVHADLHGATSVIIKNPTGQPVSPKTLNEAGCMAVSYSAAWEARIVTSAWWVHHSQVSKTAPTGEYLTTGSFMIRGKKNFLPPCYLMMGFGFMFKLDDTCIENHLNERRTRAVEESESIDDVEGDEELSIPSDEGEEENQTSSAVQQTADQDNNDDEEDDSLFPDTSIDLQLTKEGKVQLQRGTSRSSNRRDSEESESASTEQTKQPASKQRLSAKQRRENRKKKGKQLEDDEAQDIDNNGEEEEMEEDQDDKKSSTSSEQQKQQQQQQQQQQQPAKRGKKGKLKKIKEKYGEQDEEERQMKMEILASAGPAKETKAEKRKKEKNAAKGGKGNRPVSGKPGKKDAQTNQFTKQNTLPTTEQGKQFDQEANSQSKDDINKNDGDKTNFTEQNASSVQETAAYEDNKENQAIGKETINNDKVISSEEASNSVQVNTEEKSAGAISNEGDKPLAHEKEKDIIASDDEAEDLQPKEGVSLLDSLTGIPFSEDLLLFAIPVCAPYTAVQNYKYKVKLTPGTARRGKAAKTALSTFLFSKEASQREKDLIKSLKDNDLSRYIPGKVKVSAPNLQKKKKK